MKNPNSRTEKAILNSTITLACQILYLIFGFICRTVFSYMLGKEYLGISGLFTNILTLLSFVDLGFGSILTYRLYEPMAAKDTDKIVMYLQVYRKICQGIIIVIAVLGIMIIPFLKYLVEAPNIREGILEIYLLYLLNIVISYIYVYKKAILVADQKTYIVNMITQLFDIIINLSQIIILIVWHNFILYCLTKSLFLLLGNIVCSYLVNKWYPFVLKKPQGNLSKEEAKGLIADAKGLMLTKIASEAFGGTDNIFISKYIGLGYVGILSNYQLLLTMINSVLNSMFESIAASIGNLAVTVSRERTEDVLKKLFFLNTWFYGYVCIGMSFLLKEFVMEIWLTNEYYLSDNVIYLVILEIFLRCVHYPVYSTRKALGAFSQYRIFFVIAAALNIVLDFILVKPMGIAGLVVSTIFCRGITYTCDIYVLYHCMFKKSVLSYIKMLGKWFVLLAIIWKIIDIILKHILMTGIYGFVTKIVLITFAYCCFSVPFLKNTVEFKYYINMLKQRIVKRKN